jgi:hypothetical protein
MQRLSFLKKLGLVAGMMTLPAIKLNAQTNMKKVNFRHVVYFWLNNPEDSAQRKQFLNNLKEFIAAMDNIQDVFIGVPANTKRDVVDNSYQYCLNLGFENKTQQDIYQDHPLHKKFIEKSAHLWNRVVVYDSIEI